MPDWQKLQKVGIPTRYAVATVAFLNFIYVYMLRLNVNIVIVAMVNYTAIPHTNITTAQECGFDVVVENNTETSPDVSEGEFEWDERLQSLVSGSFFWGYIITQLTGGRLAERIGTKYLFASLQITVGIVTVCLPFLASVGVEFFIMGRVMLGLAQGALVPSMQPLVARWAPESERNSFATFIFSGSQMGTILGTLFSGMMADSLGWEAVFYIEGSLSVIVVSAWLFFIYDSPALHPRISRQEREYIESSTISAKNTRKLRVPWMAIIKSPPCWALLSATLGYNWAFYMLLTELPIYMRNIMHFDLKSNSMLSALPWLLMWIFSIVVAKIADMVVKRQWVSINITRKTFNTIAFCGPALCLTIVSFIGCDRYWTLAMLTLAVGLLGASYSGILINHLDLAPNFAGTLYGLVAGVACISSWVAPLVVATLTEAEQTLARWRIAFLLCAGILTANAIIFIVLGSTERQDWDRATVGEEETVGHVGEAPSSSKHQLLKSVTLSTA
ncbi:putative inorganic phosphate cotransporter isoform X1 [Daphnia pulicaria]|uniref:putative inorganic phosphate cotransporter isoform X1 n=2 Tax=Daphnia pulicaria TaxID=35523 RepID=UPI001EEB9454|nr:putative inorganic phosphate cotransporter isoform X1 [Daphnia pulicaria]